MHCTKCGAAVPDGAAFCPGCGTAVAAGKVVQPARAKPVHSPKIGIAMAIVAVLAVVAISRVQSPAAPARPKMTAAQVAECQSLVDVGKSTGIIRNQPQPRRIEVDEMTWALMAADDKRALLSAVFCVAYKGAGDTLDNAVAYGVHSGKRLAMASANGVSFE